MEPSKQQPSSNPYDFITNPGQQKKTPKLGGSSTRSRILIVLGGLMVLIILVSVVGAVISNASNADVKALKSLAAQQQELIRIADLGDDKAQSSDVRSLAYITKYSLTTQQQKLVAYLSTRKVKLTDVELAAKKKTSVDKELETAAANNNFDEVFNTQLTDGLTQYSKSMQSAYKSAKSEKAKAILSESYTSSTTLLGIK